MKYSNVPTTVDGKSFDSKGEAGRYSELVLLERAGEISNLERQVTFRLEVNGDLICKYIADFTYEERGQKIVEDFKSPATVTDTFAIKKKLMKACHGIEVRIIMSGKKAWPKRRFRR